jgi:hypothetical protein
MFENQILGNQMKKVIILSLAIIFVTSNLLMAQSGLLKKVTNSVNKEVLGKPESDENKKIQPEPPCASDQAVKAMDLGGKLEIDYSELSISILSDGRILAQAHGSDEFYVAKDGITSGPFKSGDPQIADFIPKEVDDKSEAGFLAKHKPYISKSGEKFLITFAGKKYGPYARIDYFTVSKSKDKFAAMATETVAVTEDQGKKMEEAIKNAKTDQERMEIAMEYAQQMQQTIVEGGGPESMQQKLISNVPNVTYDPLKIPNAILNGDIKYDDILLTTYDNKIYDLQGKLLFSMKQETIGAKNLFVNTNNTKYAFYNYGTLTFSDNTTLAELFNPSLVKVDGKVYLTYMYYSPKRNAIMQHKIPF